MSRHNFKRYRWLIPVLLLLTGLVFQVISYVDKGTHQQITRKVGQSQNKLQITQKKVDQTLADKQPHVSQATDKLNALFTKDWTLASQEAFDGRAEAMKPLVTESVRKTSLDFKPDSDRLMTQTGMKLVFDHMVFLPEKADSESVSGRAIVYVKSNYPDKPEAMTHFIYQVSYAPKDDLITLLDRQGSFELNSDSTGL
ncbi:hypothetical protein [Leuconostoc pseudomesenteroides]|uniref:hypothetical protein n=1 Tax=Leuconostoc pseudomesenteroides TaxID=33968 RepID=UPI0032DF44DE